MICDFGDERSEEVGCDLGKKDKSPKTGREEPLFLGFVTPLLHSFLHTTNKE
jgi:hypothetical protein